MSAAVEAVAAPDNYAPVSRECDVSSLPVAGKLPPGLRGTLYRNGPNPQFPSPDKHWFVGDGMVHAITLADGAAGYRNRWIRTPRWQAEHAAGRVLFQGFGVSGPKNVDNGVANTNVLAHAGRLLALEEAHLPMELDAATLDARGYHDFGGRLSGPFTAHPKIDPVTGEMVFFAYSVGGKLSRLMRYGTMAPDGRIGAVRTFKAPYCAMVHDFIVTARYVLFPVLPLCGRRLRAIRGGPPFAWEPKLGAHVGILRRDRPDAGVTWHRAEACFVFHVMNAWEAGDLLHADVMQYPEPPLFPRPDGTRPDPARTEPRLCRWTLRPGVTDSFASTPLDDLAGEFPRIDERRAGLPNRHGWFSANARPGGGLDSVAEIDLHTGRRTLLTLPPGDETSEPVFVPESTGSAEGEGWILAVFWRATEAASDFVVLRAGAIADGPVATVRLPQRVPVGFHGNWVAAT